LAARAKSARGKQAAVVPGAHFRANAASTAMPSMGLLERPIWPRPDHLMSRDTLVPVVVKNTPENLRAWIKALISSSRVLMPAMNLNDRSSINWSLTSLLK